MKAMNWVLIVFLILGMIGNMTSGNNIQDIQLNGPGLAMIFSGVLLYVAPIATLSAISSPNLRFKFITGALNLTTGAFLLIALILMIIGGYSGISLTLFIILAATPFLLNFNYLRNQIITTRNVAQKKEIQPNWWRRQSLGFRSWAFISVTWAGMSFFYILVFDPFDFYYADNKDILKAYLIIFAPVIFGAIKKAYDRIVK